VARVLAIKARIPRRIEDPFRSTIIIGGAPIKIDLRGVPKREPPPRGGALGAGAITEVSGDVDDAMADDAAAAVAEDWLVRATNETLLLTASLARNEKSIPALRRTDFEDMTITISAGGGATRPRPSRIRRAFARRENEWRN
jgi:hypothetical protein